MSTPIDQLETARLALARCEAKGIELASSISDSHWPVRPAQGGWSPAECFAHLNLTTTAMLPLLRAGAQEARAHQWMARKAFRTGLLAKLLGWFLEPPYRIKTSTQPAFVPVGAAAKAEVLKSWKEGHAALDTLIRGSAGFALDRPMITSPFDPKGRLRYSTYAALLILGAHERRHLWQAARAAK